MWTLAKPVMVLMVVGAAVGLVNHLSRFRTLFVELTPAESCEAPRGEPVEVTPAQASTLCAQPGIVILDARSAELYARGHVAEALHLPCSAGVLNQEVTSRLESAGDILVYASTTREAQPVGTSLLRHELTTNVYILAGGYTAWESAGLACSSGACLGCEDHHP